MAREVTVDQAARALRKAAGPSTKKALSAAMREVSKEGQSRVRTSWARQDIRPSKANSVVGRRASQTAAKVFLRYSRHPYAAGVAWGALAYRQFPRWVGNAISGATWKDMHLLGPELVKMSEGEAARIFANSLDELLEGEL